MTTEPLTFSQDQIQGLLAVALVSGLLVASTTMASAVSVSTKLACRADYRSFCSMHTIGSNELRQCMNTNGPRLTAKCINALVAEGEISKEEVARRAAGSR